MRSSSSVDTYYRDPADTAAAAPPATRSRRREDIGDRYKWNLTDIFPSWDAWEAAYRELEAGIGRYAALKGTLGAGPDRLLAGLSTVGDTRATGVSRVRISVATVRRRSTGQFGQRQAPAGADSLREVEAGGSWFNPELLKIPLGTVRAWMDTSEPLRLYRFAIEDLYRQQEHVLDEAGERLMSLSSRLSSAPNDAYWALSTADAKFPTIKLSTGEDVTGCRTANTAPSWPPVASSLIVPPRSGRCTRPIRTASTRTRRSARTAFVSVTGFRRVHAATRQRLTPRCTATTSHPPSSKT